MPPPIPNKNIREVMTVATVLGSFIKVPIEKPKLNPERATSKLVAKKTKAFSQLESANSKNQKALRL
jgi:hypothetical protein